ncbi:MAG: hypothetical protein JWN34_42 [Bryobacterales bacterium]|nr:hypothetical protein [Bryobacterales bacterium]
MPQNRAEELTYYDELGVTPDASPDQIREAFRSLVRLLHPDHQVDEHLKAVAELQMRKLNRTYSVLSDPGLRRAYDAKIQHGPTHPHPQPRPTPPPAEQPPDFSNNRSVSRYAWLVAAVCGISILLWFTAETSAGSSAATTQRPEPPAPAFTESPSQARVWSAEVAQLRNDLRIARSERDLAVGELIALRQQNAVAPSRSEAAEPRRVETPSPVSLAPPAEIPATQFAAAQPLTTAPTFRVAPPRLPARTFGGFWFYVRANGDRKSSQLYPPEFIEATIVEQNGQVQGHYRSRYRIVDRAISPDVNFNFTGTVNLGANTVTADWTGPGGARGELTIKLLGENSARVDWSADRLGNMQGLTAGTATLTRRLD